MPEAKFVLKEPTSTEPTLVYLFYYFSSIKLKYSTSQKIHPKNWNSQKQRAKELRSFTESANFNFLLDKIETAVNDAYRKFIIDGVIPTSLQLKTAIDEALNKTSNNTKDFVNFSENVLNASDRKEVTKKAIRQTLNILREFQADYKRQLHFDNIDLDFYNDFVDCLTREKNLKPSTIGSHIKNVKVFMREAFERGLTKNTQFQSKRFRKPNEESETIYLTNEEIKQIKELDLFQLPRLDRVRDLFIIACYTGLRFSDLVHLNIESMNKDKRVIKVKTQKTDELVLIPMNSTVSEIIEKYEGNLPRMSNQKMNDYLKEIGMMAGIDETIERVSTKGGKRIKEVFKKFELITVHTARRSFATNAYLMNVPSIGIMKITGHRTEKTFLKYIKISQEDNANKLINHPFFS
jgi:integrase